MGYSPHVEERSDAVGKLQKSRLRASQVCLMRRSPCYSGRIHNMSAGEGIPRVLVFCQSPAAGVPASGEPLFGKLALLLRCRSVRWHDDGLTLVIIAVAFIVWSIICQLGARVPLGGCLGV